MPLLCALQGESGRSLHKAPSYAALVAASSGFLEDGVGEQGGDGGGGVWGEVVEVQRYAGARNVPVTLPWRTHRVPDRVLLPLLLQRGTAT